MLAKRSSTDWSSGDERTGNDHKAKISAVYDFLLSGSLWAVLAFFALAIPAGLRGHTSQFMYSMLSKRYTIVLADRTTGVVRRFTIGVKPALKCWMELNEG